MPADTAERPAATRYDDGRVAPPRQVPAGRVPRPSPAARRADAEARPPQRRHTALRRLLAGLVLLVIVIAIIVAAVLLSHTSPSTFQYRKIVAHDAQTAINQIQSLVNRYTK